MPRVLHITETALGGVARYLGYVLPELQKQNWQVDLILSPLRAEPDVDQLLKTMANSGIAVYMLPMQHSISLAKDPVAIAKIRRIIQDTRPDVVHMHSTKAGLLGRLAAVGCPCKKVYTPHAYYFQHALPPAMSFMALAMEKLLGRFTDAYAVVSESEQSITLEKCGIPSAKVFLVRNGLPRTYRERMLSRAEARQAMGIAEHQTAVVFVGRLTEQKGVGTLIRSLAMNAAQRHHVYIIGSGPQESKLKGMAAELGVSDRITWKGFISDPHRFYAGFDAGVIPSSFEGLSYVFMEMLMAGLPVVTSDLQAFAVNLQQTLPVIRVAPGNPALLADALAAQLLTHTPRPPSPELLNYFSLEQQIAQLLDCYSATSSA